MVFGFLLRLHALLTISYGSYFILSLPVVRTLYEYGNGVLHLLLSTYQIKSLVDDDLDTSNTQE